MIQRHVRGAQKRRKIAVWFVLLAMLGAITAYILWQDTSSSGNDIIVGDVFPGGGEAVEGHLPNMTEENIQEQMQREADKNMFAFKINARPLFKDGCSEGTLRIENPSHNIYPFVVKIFLDVTKEEIYNSGGILPDYHINTAKLTKNLPKGEYTATAYIYAYDPKTSEYGGKAAVELTIIVTS